MLIALMLGWATLYADRTCLYPLLSVIAGDLSLSSTQAGSLTSAYFIVYVTMQIPAGIAGDNWGLKRVMMIMFAIAGLGMFGLGTMGKTYPLLVLFSALSGMGAGAYYSTCYGTLFQVVSPDRRALSGAIIGIGMSMGLFIGMTLSGPVYEAVGNFRLPFLILSVPTFAMVAVIHFLLPRVKCAPTPALRDYLALFRDMDIWKINFATLASLYGFWLAMAWGPTFLKVERGFSLSQAGFFTGLMAITAIPAGLFWGRLSDRVNRKLVALIVLPASALVLVLLTKVTSMTGIVVTLMVYGMLSNSAIVPVMVAWLGDVVSKRYPGKMGAATGFFNCVVMSSAIFAPVISGFLRDLTDSLEPAFWAAGGIMMAGATLVFFTPLFRGRTWTSITTKDTE